MSSLIKQGKFWIITYYFNHEKRRRSLKVKSQPLAETVQTEYDDLIKKGIDPDHEFRKKKVDPSVFPEIKYLDEAVNNFLEYTDERKDLSQCTRTGYKHFLKNILLFNPETKRPGIIKERIEMAKIDSEFLRESILEQMNKWDDFAHNTKMAFIRSLKVFFVYAKRKKWIDKNPFEDVQEKEYKIKYKSSTGQYSEDEIERFRSFFRNEKTDHFQTIGDITFFVLNTGLRRLEVSNLRWSDINDDYTMRVMGKGSKVRTVTLSDEAVKILEKRKAQRDKNKIKDMRIFNELTYQMVMHHFREVKKKCGLQGRTFHTLRDTYATMFIRKGGNLEELRQQLGHASINQTMKYVHITAQDRVRNRNLVCIGA